jgi:hypothetical protein
MKDPLIPLSRIALLVMLCAIAVGCGGGASTSSVPTPITPPPTSSTATLSGQWEIVAHSNVNPASSILVEANFSQSGSNVVADKANVVLIEGAPGAFTGLSGECDNGTLGDDTVTASISGQTVTYTLTEAGALGTGTSTGSATISADGTQITSGTYQTPAACGFSADSGSLTGTAIQPLSGTFAGQLVNFVGTADAVVLTVSQSGYTLNAVGTDAGAPISLTGKVIGATFDVKGIVQGQSREYVGVYVPSSKNFLVYDTSFDLLGSLAPQSPAPSPNPIRVSVSPTTETVAVGATQTFTATVMNDTAAKGVTWTVSCGTANGCGSLSATTGISITYSAPSSVPSPATVTLTAISAADTTRSASSTITVTAPQSNVNGVTISCSPDAIPITSQASCSAIVSGTNSPSQSVTWSASSGSVTPGGVFTPHSAGSVVVTAVSTSDPTKSGTASLDVHVDISPILGQPGSDPTLIVDDVGNLDLSWVQPAGGEAVFARSVDHGDTFQINPITGSDGATFAQMGIDGQGIVTMLWDTPTDPQVYGTSSDNGNTFTTTDISGIVGTGLKLSVSQDGLVDVVKYSARPPINGKGIFSTVLNGSQVPVEVVDDAKDVNAEQTVATGPQGQVYVVWQSGEEVLPECTIVFSRSLDAGATFSTPLNVSNNPNECGQIPQIFVDNSGAIDLVWTTIPGFSDDNGPLVNPNVVFFSRSTDQGATFSTPVPLVNINQYSAVGDPQIAVGLDGTIAIVFIAESGSDSFALVSKSTNEGKTFAQPVTVSGGANFPSITIDSCGGINVAWTGDKDAFYSRSADGVTFSTPMNVSNFGIGQTVPLMASDQLGSVFVVWSETNIYGDRIVTCR